MSLLKSFEFIPGIKWFESEMHDTLFQHSVFGAIVFLIVSNTGVYKLVKDTIFQCCGIKVDGNTLQLVHAVVFMVIMYFGSMYLFAPLLGEGMGKGMVEGFKNVEDCLSQMNAQGYPGWDRQPESYKKDTCREQVLPNHHVK